MLDEWNPLTFVVLILASYRFTHLIVFDKITEFIRQPFMKKEMVTDSHGHTKVKKVPKSKFGYLLNCYWCAGVWSAIIITLTYMYIPKYAISIAGAQAILETIVGVGTQTVGFLSKLKDKA